MRRSPAARLRATGGFTFVEVLAAMLFLAILVPTIVTALSLANRASEITERGTTAAQLAENKLNEMLVGKAWQSAPSSGGDFGASFPGYRWEMTEPQWSADTSNSMTQLKVEVFFKVQGAERSVALTTLVNSLSATSTTGTTSLSGTP